MIKKLSLSNFRNHAKKNLEFQSGVNIMVGPNASGKTNILESVLLLSSGKSFKAGIESEMIKMGENIATVLGGLENDTLEIKLTTGENGWPRKKLLLNGTPKRLIDFAGNLKVVFFAPQDMDLVTGSPSLRRRFLDSVLSQVDREYRRCLLSYEKGLRQRNRLLMRIREEGASRSQLLFWNQLLVKNGDYLSIKRNEFIEFCNESKFQIQDSDFHLEYDRSAISEARLEQYKNEEVAAATTLVGPHRDDMVFKYKDSDLASFGSRGEQRMGVLWLKMAELAFIKEKTNTNPVLLLDDIFSELDHKHRDTVIEITKKQQTIITTADEHFLEGIDKSNIINLNGKN